MAGEQEQLGILIKAQDEASAILKNVATQVDGLTKKTTGLTSGMKSASSGMSVLKTAAGALVGVAGFAGISMAVNTMTGFMKSSVQQFEEADAIYNRLSNTILNQKGATQANIDALVRQSEVLASKSTLDDTAIQAGQAQIATFNGMTAAMVEKLTPAWLDYAVKEHGMVISTEMAKQSANDMTKAVEGQTEALTRQGFKLSESDKEILKNGSMIDRVNVVINAMAYAHGAAASAAETFEGKQLRLTNQLNEGKKAFGGIVDLVKGDFIDAFVNGGKGMENFGDNALQIAKQVGDKFIDMGKAVIDVMQGISSIGNMGKIVVAGGNESKSWLAQKGLDLMANQQGAGAEKAKEWLKSQIMSDDQLQKNVDDTNKAIDAQSEYNKTLDEKKSMLDQDKVEINNLKTISQLYSKGSGNGGVDMSPPDSADSGAAAKKWQDLQDKVIKFKRDQVDLNKKIHDDATQQTKDLADLKTNYVRDVKDIKDSIDDLTKSYDKAGKSAEESFQKQQDAAKDSLMGGILGAANTAKKTLQDRMNQLAGLQNSGGDPSKIAALQALNVRDQKILDDHKQDIEDAQKKADDMQTALGLQDLYDKYDKERAANQKNYDDQRADDKANYLKQKADLDQQLLDKKKSYDDATQKLVDSNKTALEKMKDNYLQAFDEIKAAIIDFGKDFDTVMATTAIPAISKAALDSFASLQKNAPVKKRASGGPIYSGETYLVGEEGPELITAGSNANVIPNNALTSNQSINVTINVTEKVGLQEVAKFLDQYLGQKAINRQYGIS